MRLQRIAKTVLKAFSGKEKKTKSSKSEEVYKILLLTNRDSDNVGDQVIEACDIGLIEAAMKNLNVERQNYKLESRAASIVSRKYLSTKDENILKKANKVIREADLVIFGGAPMFNYRYQVFYERTAITLEIAEKHGTPVLFSAIGVEGYNEDNAKCQRLKKTLNFDCVKQITTRDDFDSLKKFRTNERLIMNKVSDPAVFAAQVFKNYISHNDSVKKKKIGIFVLRANGFKDNKIDFSKDEAADLWKALTQELEAQEYDYELLTSGHFADEAFLDYLIRDYDVPVNKCVFNMNSPERLIRKISSYDAVISTRLHPSIISFSLNVPSVGIVWNSKVEYFYRSIGYEDRIIDVKGIEAKDIVKKIERIMDQGLKKDKEFLISVYNSLFYGIKAVLCPEERSKGPYTYEKLVENIPTYKGTSEKEKEKKLKRKFRRIYRQYNELFATIVQYKELTDELRSEIESLKNRES